MFLFKFSIDMDNKIWIIKYRLCEISVGKTTNFGKFFNFLNLTVFLLFTLKTANLAKMDILTSFTIFVHHIFAMDSQFDRY